MQLSSFDSSDDSTYTDDSESYESTEISDSNFDSDIEESEIEKSQVFMGFCRQPSGRSIKYAMYFTMITVAIFAVDIQNMINSNDLINIHICDILKLENC